MRLDERARRAAGGIHHAVDEHETRSPLGALDRFEVANERRQRHRRIGAGGVGVALTAVAIAFAVRTLSPTTMPAPASDHLPRGTLLVGEWDPRTDTAHWTTVGMDGGGRVDLGLDTSCAAWFPDGRRILITDDASGFPLRPAVVSADGSLLARLDATRDSDLSLGCGDVSPDGSRLVLEGFNEAEASRLDGIYSVRAADGGDLRRLTSGVDGYPTYSPDGSEVVFLRTKPGIHPDGAGALFVVGVDGSGLRRITPWGAAFLHQDWSPDGEWIVFQRPYGELFVVHPDGTALHRVPLPLPAGVGAREPAWSPDGEWIVFAAEGKSGAFDLFVMTADGTQPRPLTRTPVTDSAPDWGGG